MSIPWPRCGNDDPHPPHLQSGAGLDCPGWTSSQQVVRHLITSVNEYVRDNYVPGNPLPDGLRLEMHPSVRRLLMTDLDLWERPGRATTVDDWFPAPVRVTMDLKTDQWRLVIVTEEVLLSSQVPAGSRSSTENLV